MVTNWITYLPDGQDGYLPYWLAIVRFRNFSFFLAASFPTSSSSEPKKKTHTHSTFFFLRSLLSPRSTASRPIQASA